MLECRPDHVPEFRQPGFKSKKVMSFWTSDWLGDQDVQGLTRAEKGWYLEAIFCDSAKGYLAKVSGNVSETSSKLFAKHLRNFLPKVLQEDARTLCKLWGSVEGHFFVTSDGYIINKRCERERARLRKERGRKAGIPPENGVKSTPPPTPTPIPSLELDFLKKENLGRLGKTADRSHEEILNLWNDQISGVLMKPKIRRLTQARRRKLKARLEEIPDLFDQVLKIAPSVDGFVRENSWCTFDWLVRSEANAQKFVEGAYVNQKEAAGRAIDERLKAKGYLR